MNHPDLIARFVAAIPRLRDRVPVALNAIEIDDLSRALLAADAAIESVEKGEVVPYLREVLDDDEFGLTRQQQKDWRALRVRLDAERRRHHAAVETAAIRREQLARDAAEE